MPAKMPNESFEVLWQRVFIDLVKYERVTKHYYLIIKY